MALVVIGVVVPHPYGDIPIRCPVVFDPITRCWYGSTLPPTHCCDIERLLMTHFLPVFWRSVVGDIIDDSIEDYGDIDPVLLLLSYLIWSCWCYFIVMTQFGDVTLIEWYLVSNLFLTTITCHWWFRIVDCYLLFVDVNLIRVGGGNCWLHCWA